MKRCLLLLLIFGILLIAFSAHARDIFFASWHNKLNTEFNYVLQYEKGDDPFTSINLNVYHYGGQKDTFFNKISLTEGDHHLVSTQFATGDYAVITARDGEGYSEQSFTGLAGLPSLKQFDIFVSVDKPVAAPGDSLNLHVDVRNGREPYQHVETICTIGEEYKAFATFAGEGDFTLNLDKALFAGQSTCVISVEAKDSAGQSISKQLYLQISDAPMEPLRAEIKMKDGQAFYNSSRADLDITGGVPPYHFDALWLVNSLEDDIQMPGEREDDGSGSTLTWIEPGFGEVAFTVYDSQGHFIIEKAPFQAVVSGEYAALVNRVIAARNALEADPAFDPASHFNAEHRKLLGRWVPLLKNFRGELYFYYDGTFYVDIAETELPRMNLMETFSGIVQVQARDMKVYQTGKYMEGSTDLPYTIKDGKLEVFFSPVESVVFIQDKDFVNWPLESPAAAAGPQAPDLRDYEYAELADGTLEIVKYKGQAETLMVPGELNGNTVSRIGASAFNECSSLISITLPGGVTSIGTSAFSFCENLTSIALPDKLEIVSDNPFHSCSRLSRIVLSPNHEHFAVREGILFSKQEPRLICYPAGLNNTSYQVPQGIQTIGNNAFTYAGSLLSVILPDSLTSIGGGAFSSCYQLTSMTLPEGLRSIGRYAFEDCIDITNINLPDSLTYIGEAAFTWCQSLSSIDLPNGVTSIADKTFDTCSSLTSITLPGSLTSIGSEALASCASLASITLPGSLAYIGKDAFRDCPELTEIIVAQGSYAEQYCKDFGLPFIYRE